MKSFLGKLVTHWSEHSIPSARTRQRRNERKHRNQTCQRRNERQHGNQTRQHRDATEFGYTGLLVYSTTSVIRPCAWIWKENCNISQKIAMQERINKCSCSMWPLLSNKKAFSQVCVWQRINSCWIGRIEWKFVTLQGCWISNETL